MSRYKKYLQEIEERKTKGLQPKPIDAAELLDEIIDQIKDEDHEHRINSINFFIYNVLPGTTTAARVKAKFLKEIILGETELKEISIDFAFELLSHMKGGPSIEVLLDLALGEDNQLDKGMYYFVFWINHNNQHFSTHVSQQQLFDWFQINKVDLDNKLMKETALEKIMNK